MRHSKIKLPRLSLPLWASALLLLGLTAYITAEAVWCQPKAFRTVLDGFRAQPLLFLLNAMPIGFLLLALSFLLRNVCIAGALVNLGVGILSIANRVKLEVRDEPVFPRDFGLLKEVGSVMGDFDISYPVTQIAVVLLASLVLLLLGGMVRSAPFPVKPLRGWKGSLLGTAAGFCFLTALIFTVYASNDLYNSFRVSNAYYIPAVFNELGFPYCFCHQFTTYPIDKPDGFSKAEAEAWETEPEPGQGKQVHLVMVMNEAFSDITDAEVFDFAEGDDPLTNLHALQNDPHAISGHIVVPGFAGGTANTEFDVLTGMQTNALSVSATSSFRVVNRNLDSVLRVFRDDGYHTAFYHPGDNWFYNRENVYRWLGAEETVFVDEMPDVERKGGYWVADHYVAGFLENKFQEAVDAGQWLCSYTTTIQNHMAYTADKYGADYVCPEVPLKTQVSDQTATMLKVYVEGVRDADAMLGSLHDYFADRDEPVVLAFWGDHLPYLGDNQLGYTELGLEIAKKTEEREDPFAAYETPYVVWANDAAAEVLDWDSAVERLDLPQGEKLSASFLGAMLLDLTGRGTETPWFAFLNDLRREMPVVQKGTCQFPDGSITDTPTDEQTELISKWRKWSYYKLRYKDIAG